MEYKAWKLSFSGGVHFGSGSLERSEIAFHADTLFSALCHEALKEGGGELEKLHSYAERGSLLLSDAFPYIGEESYLPKPCISIKGDAESRDSSKKKLFKKMEYVPLSLYARFLKGDFPEEAAREAPSFGNHMHKASVSTREEDDPKPYRVGSFWFRQDAGLCVIAGFSESEAEALCARLLSSLAYSGIGGERSSGLGRFEIKEAPVPDALRQGLAGERETSVLLSASLPRKDELERALEGASYQMVRRGGFVASETYADRQMRKRDVYLFKAGSVFKNKFSGGVYDVSDGGAHPVYRYAKPMFLGVDI